MRCVNCDTEAVEGDAFCGGCGHRLPAAATAVATTQENEVTVEAPPLAARPPAAQSAAAQSLPAQSPAPPPPAPPPPAPPPAAPPLAAANAAAPAVPTPPYDTTGAGNRTSDLGGIGIATMIALGALVVGSTLDGLISLLTLGSPEILESGAATAITVLNGLGMLACAVLVPIFCYRAYSHLVRSGVPGMQHTPGWAVGTCFIPWRTQKMAAELWRGATQGAGDADVQVPPQRANWPFLYWFGVLWTVVTIGNVMSAVQSGDAEAFENVLMQYAVRDTFFAVSGILLLLFVREIVRARRGSAATPAV